MLRGLFARGRGQPDPDREAAERVKDLVLEIGIWPEGTAVTVSEIVCQDPACPGQETVILVMIPGRRTKAVKVSAPAVDVTEQRLRSALVEAGLGVGE